jgi:thiol:disulfide interchange protein DsbA
MSAVHRRQALAAGSALLLGPALAQTAVDNWREGVHYTRLAQPVPGPADKIEVVEFFWYGCPLCNAFEPALQAWVKQLPAWVSFRHQHLFLREATRPHQRLFFTLQAMGVESQYRAAIFAAMHQQGQALDSPEAMLKLLQPLGLDAAKFSSAWAAFEPRAFSAARIESANRQAAQAYRVNGVPTLAIGGRYLVSPPEASERRAENPIGGAALRVADHLLSTLRQT